MRSAPLQPVQAVVPRESVPLSGGFSRNDSFAIIAVTFWALNVALSKVALQEIDVLVFIALRISLSAVVALLALLVLERRWRIKRRDVVFLGILGLFGVGMAQFVFVVGLNLSYASHGALLLGANPVFAGLLAGWLGWDQFKRKNWFGVLVCLGGLILLTGIGSTAFSPTVLLGDAIALTSAFFGACYTVFSKRFLGEYSPLQILTYGLLVSSVPMLLLANNSLRAQDWSSISFEVYAIIAFAAILGTVVSTILWLKSVTRIGILRTSLYQYLLPVVGLILALVLLHEQLDPTQWVGIAIVLFGIYFARSS